MSNYEAIIFYLLVFFFLIGFYSFCINVIKGYFWARDKITEIKNRPKYTSLREVAERFAKLTESERFFCVWIKNLRIRNGSDDEDLETIAYHLIENATQLYQAARGCNDIYLTIEQPISKEPGEATTLPYDLNILDVYVKTKEVKSIIKKTIKLVRNIQSEYDQEDINIFKEIEKTEAKKSERKEEDQNVTSC